MIYSRFRPWKTQSEPFIWKSYLLQTFCHFAFAVLWWYFGYIGEKPLSGTPVVVTPDISINRQIVNSYDRVGYLLHLLLYVFVTVHQTVLIQVAHVTHQKFNPLSRIYVATMIIFVVCIIIHLCKK